MRFRVVRSGGGERSRSENRWRVQKGERRWGDDEGEVIMMQKSQFSGRLGAMRRDTPRCCAIIITTGDIIPSPDLQRGWRELRRSKRISTDRPAASDALLMGIPDHPARWMGRESW